MVRRTRVEVTVWVVLRKSSSPDGNLEDMEIAVYPTKDLARSNVGYLDPEEYVIKEFTYY
jgi:hypothetical protein